jgi:PAS domain S-box-containing protein
MTKKYYKYRILIAENLSSNERLNEREIKKVLPQCIFKKVRSEKDFLQAAEQFMPDLILFDYETPGFNGLTIFKLAHERIPYTPLIIITASINEDAAVECMKAGAADYVIKEHIKRLGPAVFKAIEQKKIMLEKQKAQTALIENEERFRMVFENVFDGIGIYIGNPDPFKRKLFECNEQYAAMAGRSRQELLQLGSTQELQITLEGNANKNSIKALNKEKMYQGTFSWIRPDEKENIIECAVRPFTWRGQEYSISIDRDITDLKYAENELRKLSKVVEQSPASVIITDKSGNIEYINPKVTEITGYKFEEVVGKNPRIFKSGGKSKKDYKVLWDTINSGKEWRGEFQNKKKNGEIFWESALISPMLNEKKEISRFIAIKVDITEYKIILEELIIAKEKTEQSDKLKSEFLSQVSHEIRTPLIYIINYTDLIKDEIKEGNFSGLPEYLGTLSEAGKRIERTFDLIFSSAQILTNNFSPKFINLNLTNDILLQVYNEFKNQADLKKLDYIYIDNSKNKNIIADRYSVHQLFSNLVDNAIKYTKKGFVKIEVSEEDCAVLVKVIDSGIGISKEFLSHIFESFSQEEHGYTRQYEGNGLGLMLAKKYCEINGAEIDVKSIKDKGSTFTVKFNLH